MTYPNFTGKHQHTALFGPEEFLEYLREQGGLHPGLIPESFVLCYERRFFDEIERTAVSGPVAHRNRRVYAIDEPSASVGIAGGFGIGAPAATMTFEELVALGARHVVSIGFAGALAPDLEIGDVVLCTSAVRDEGVSHHYLPAGRIAAPSARLTEALRASLERAGLAYVAGPTWTIDAPYRETIEEVQHYQADGVLTVEMEAAALFAVGEYRGVEVASAFVVSDLLNRERWHAQFHDAVEALGRVYEATLDALTAP